MHPGLRGVGRDHHFLFTDGETEAIGRKSRPVQGFEQKDPRDYRLYKRLIWLGWSVQRKLNWLDLVSAPQRAGPLPSSQLTFTCLEASRTLCYSRLTLEDWLPVNPHFGDTLPCPDFFRNHLIRCNTRTPKKEVALPRLRLRQQGPRVAGGWAERTRQKVATVQGPGNPATYLDRVDPTHVHVAVGQHEGPDGAGRLGRRRPQQQQLAEHRQPVQRPHSWAGGTLPGRRVPGGATHFRVRGPRRPLSAGVRELS